MHRTPSINPRAALATARAQRDREQTNAPMVTHDSPPPNTSARARSGSPDTQEGVATGSGRNSRQPESRQDGGLQVVARQAPSHLHVVAKPLAMPGSSATAAAVAPRDIAPSGASLRSVPPSSHRPARHAGIPPFSLQATRDAAAPSDDETPLTSEPSSTTRKRARPADLGEADRPADPPLRIGQIPLPGGYLQLLSGNHAAGEVMPAVPARYFDFTADPPFPTPAPAPAPAAISCQEPAPPQAPVTGRAGLSTTGARLRPLETDCGMFELMIAVEVKKNEARLAAMEVAQAAAPTQPAPIPLDGGSAGQR